MAYYDAALAAIEADAAGGSNELRVACELNKARAFLKLQDEGACLAACERAVARRSRRCRRRWVRLCRPLPSQAAGSASQMVRDELGLPASHGGQPEQ